jgi:hypothetical protein
MRSLRSLFCGFDPPAPVSPPAIEEGYESVLAKLKELNPDYRQFVDGGSRYVDSPLTYENTNVHLDRVFSFSRRILKRDRIWRYGPHYAGVTFRDAYDRIKPYINLGGRTYCDLGCGTLHPFGTSVAMYLNGARTCTATDLHAADSVRAAEAVYDQLVAALSYPAEWHVSSIPREQFVERVHQFNLRALEEGDLSQGFAGVCLQHVITDIHDPKLPPESFDVMTSRSVLEHFLDFPAAARRLFQLMTPEGVAYHWVDVADHRAYSDPSQFHEWSLLAEDEGWSDGLVNTLRPCELRAALVEAGFEVLAQQNDHGEFPEGFVTQIRGRFTAMSTDELRIRNVRFVLFKSVRSAL